MKTLLFFQFLFLTLHGEETHHFQLSKEYFQKGLGAEISLQMVHAAGSKIALSLPDCETIRTYRERIFALLETYTDVLIIDEEQACALTQLPPEKCTLYLNNFCPNVIIQQIHQ